MHLIAGLLRGMLGFVVLGAAAAATLGVFGFALPLLDLFNHLQLILFWVLLAGSVVLPLLVQPGALRWAVVGLTLFGLLASAFMLVPDMVLSLRPRPALPADGRPVVSIMTHNILGDNDDMGRIAAVVKAENPDILALQELFPYQYRRLDPLLAADYPYRAHCTGGKRAHIGLYAKVPFTTELQGGCAAGPGNDERTARIIARFSLAGGAALTVVTTHLDWPLPIARKEGQLAVLAAAMRKIEGPLVLVGDFNATAWSYAIRGFAADAGLELQDHMALTYPVKFLFDRWRPTVPVLSLDHAFSRNVAVTSLAVGPQTSSDHLPLVLTVAVPPGSAPRPPGGPPAP